jgi:hypothetical protein
MRAYVEHGGTTPLTHNLVTIWRECITLTLRILYNQFGAPILRIVGCQTQYFFNKRKIWRPSPDSNPELSIP